VWNDKKSLSETMVVFINMVTENHTDTGYRHDRRTDTYQKQLTGSCVYNTDCKANTLWAIKMWQSI